MFEWIKEWFELFKNVNILIKIYHYFYHLTEITAVEKTSNSIYHLIRKHDTEITSKLNISLKQIPNIRIPEPNLKNAINDLDSFNTKMYADTLTLFMFNKFYHTNPLFPNKYPLLRIIEKSLIDMTLDLYNAYHLNARGCITSGETESIFLVCKAYRDYFNYSYPQIAAPDTAYPSLRKACEYLNIKLVPYKKNMSLANTIMILGSLPSYINGVIDPIEEMGELGIKNNIPVHIDAFQGGFIIPFSDKCDKYDFEIPGITSISTNYEEPGISCLMYNTKRYIKHQYFICEDYCGSIYATSSLLGNRSGSTIAITWGNIVTKGFNYYKHRANSIISNTEILASRIGNIDHIRIVNTEFINVVVFTSDVYDITYLYQKLDHLEVEFIHDSLHLFTTTITSNRDTIIDIIKSNLIEKTLSSETPMLRRSMKSVAYNYLDTLFT